METLAPKLFTVLTKCVRALANHATRNIAELGLCPSDFAVLEALLHKGPLTVGAIGEKVLLTSGSMTAAVDRLADKELVLRRESATDRRERVIELTPAGRRLIERAWRDHESALETAVSGLSRREQNQLLELAKRLGLSAAESLPLAAAPVRQRSPQRAPRTRNTAGHGTTRRAAR